MVAVRKHTMIAAVVALLALAVPLASHAGTTTYAPPYAAGPRGGDPFNAHIVDQASGYMAVVRANVVPANTGLGCGGSGGFANFAVGHTASGVVRTVTVQVDNAVIDPYTFIKVGVRQGNGFLGSTVAHGPIVGSRSVTVDISSLNATGAITVWFGIETSSACPNVDGGFARFSSVSVEEA